MESTVTTWKADTPHHWRVVFAGPVAHGHVYLDDKEVTGVRALSVEARVGDLVQLTLEVLPGSLEVEGYGKPAFTSARPSLWRKFKHALAI